MNRVKQLFIDIGYRKDRIYLKLHRKKTLITDKRLGNIKAPPTHQKNNREQKDLM